MSKRKNSKKKNNNKAQNIKERIVQELAPEATQDTVDMLAVCDAETEAAPVAGNYDEDNTVIHISDEEVTTVPHNSEVTDFTLMMDPLTENEDTQDANSENKFSKTGKFKEAASKGAGRIHGAFDKPVTRKFVAAALGLTLVLNGAIAAGIMSMYSRGIKKDVANVRETVSELENSYGNSGRSGKFGGGPGMGVTPPDLDYDDSWGSEDNYYGGRDNNYDEYWGDDSYDSSVPYSGNSQGQSGSSNVSIGIVISDNDGVYISQVTGSNAQKAGFQAGDKIVSFDGEDIDDSSDLIEEVQKHSSGDKVKVVVERNGKEIKLTTTLD